MNLNLKARNYFNFFSKKNLDGLKQILDKRVLLIDWQNKIIGFNNLIKFNKKIFKKFKKINIKVKETYINQNNKSIACKIVIELDYIKLKIIDIIYFNNKKKIIKIEAYKL